MKKLSIILVLISFVFVNVQAQQQSDIKQIRKWYYATKNEISTSKKDKSDAELYCDITERNAHGASWRAVGNYNSKTQYWYSDDSQFMPDEYERRTCLKMVINNKTSSIHKYYSEYLYHDGQLVFVFYKINDDELRLYFKNNKLIKQIGKITDLHPNVKNLQSIAEDYMKVYLSTRD